jgi:hypothetical protein
MNPMSLYTLDAKTLQQVALRDGRASTCGERAERGFGAVAVGLLAVAMLAVFLF